MRTSLLIVISLLLLGCGGAEVEQNTPPPVQDNSNNYTGLAPQTDDVQQFKLNLWDNVVAENRCGSCHQQGNTAPYLQYAYTRIQSIFRKADLKPEQITGEILLGHIDEKTLAIKLLQSVEVIEQISTDAYPHLLCNYLYDVASLYMRFYESCPILKESVSAAAKSSRLQLCDATAATLKIGLDILGIEVMEKM